MFNLFPFSIVQIVVGDAPLSASHFQALWEPLEPLVYCYVYPSPHGVSIPLQAPFHATPHVTVVPQVSTEGVLLLEV